MSDQAIYWTWAVLLVLANAGAWFATLFTLPGNWVMVALTALFAYYYPATDVIAPEAEGPGVAWMSVLVMLVLAGLGELIEFAAGAAGAARQGGSRRGMVLAIVGTIIGSILGAIVGLPIPLIGPVIAAVGGGGLGAFAGAYLGETWKGRTSAESLAVSKGALIGRLLGTLGKLITGAMMVIVSALAVAI